MTTAILLLAGASTRFNASKSKQLFLLNGKPVFSYSLNTIAENKIIDEIIVVVNDEIKEEVSNFININKIDAKMVMGGKTRQESVKNALKSSIAKDEDIILIHDGARPLIYNEIIENVINNAKKYGASTAYINEVDTLAVCSKEETIESFVDRNKIVRIQTPQAFKASLIKSAHEKANNLNATDDCSLILAMNKQVKLVLGSECLRKVTTMQDAKIIEGMIKNDWI